MSKQGQHSSRQVLIFKTIMQLLDEGVTNITYAKISERCHLHINTITYYFDGKDEMLLQCFQYIVEQERKQTPRFYFEVPPDMTPVEGLCHLVDHVLDHGRIMSPARRALNLYLWPNANISPRIRNFLLDVDRKSVQIEYDAVMVYDRAGIIEPTRLRETFADMSLISAGFSLINFFHVQCADEELALAAARSRIKRNFLKDEYHPQLEQYEQLHHQSSDDPTDQSK